MTTAPAASAAPFTAEDAASWRGEFPVLARTIGGRPLVYFDNAATTQKPRAVIDAASTFYERHNANVHRGVHTLSQEATAAYETARESIRRFLNASESREIVFTKGVTDAINLVANAWGGATLRKGDEILLTRMEHHSNIVPWQLVAERTGAVIRVAPIDDTGTLSVEAFENLLSERTKIVAFNHVSNALGTINPVEMLTALAHAAGAMVLIDGAQAGPHTPIDVQRIGCDFYAVSAHKAFGPTGAGALFGRADVLGDMQPYQGGGEMIRSVSFGRTTFADIPTRFEAGTPNIAGAIGFGAAIETLERIGKARIAAYERRLLQKLTEAVGGVPGVRLIGTAADRAPVLSFVVDGMHPHDLGTFLDTRGVAVRTGHHCTQPLMEFFGVPATTRASLAFYNTPDEIEIFSNALREAVEFFG